MMKRNTYKNRIGKALLGALTACVLLLPVSPARAAADITTGLVGYWRLDETNGPFADDIGGNSATEVNNTAAVAAQSGGGQLCENANSAYITAPAQQTYRDLRTLTVSFWTRLDDYGGFNGWLEIIGLLKVRNNYGNGRIEFHADAWDTQGGSWRVGSAYQLPQGQWAHVAMTYDYNQAVGTPPTIYINGEPVSYTTPFLPSGSITPPVDGTLYICAVDNSGIRELKGAIDDVRIYDRVLTQEDITELYRSWDGNIDYNVNARVPEYYNGDQWVAMGARLYAPNAVAFDGTNDYLSRGAGLTGAADSQKFTASFWARYAGPTSGSYTVLSANPSRFSLSYAGGGVGKMQLLLRNASGTVLANHACGPSAYTIGQWYHYLISVDVSNPANVQCYVDDADGGISTYTANVDDMIDFTTSDVFIGAVSGAANKFNGDLADLWIDFGTYIDLSVIANRRKFIDANGDPVYLGPDGSIPTGTAPDIFLSGDTATWHTNKGTGGGFTENGALTDSYSGPLDVDITSGLVAHWKFDETSGTTAYDATGNTNANMSNGLTGANSVSGQVGTALQLDGVDDKISYVASATNGPANITICAWGIASSPTNGDKAITLSQNWPSAGYNFSIKDDIDGAVYWVTLDGTPHNLSMTGLDTTVWHHYCGTADGTTQQLFIDGDLVGSQAGGYNNRTSGAAYIASAISNANTLGGAIDDVRIYNRVLSAAEVSAIYRQTAVCSGPAGYGGKIIYNADGQVLQYCDGANWRAMGPYPGAGTGGCANPTRAEGSLIFNRDYSVMQYCDGDEWVSVGSWTPPSGPTGCPTIGDTCSDGTIYAGDSPDGNVKMYTTPADAASTYTWNDGTTNYTDMSMANCTDVSPGTAATCQTGEANTAFLVAATGETDYPFAAAEHCDGLSAYGHDDWYLPAQDELNVLNTNKNTGALNGTFNQAPLSSSRFYLSSSESINSAARGQNFADDSQIDLSKDVGWSVRCVRKD